MKRRFMQSTAAAEASTPSSVITAGGRRPALPPGDAGQAATHGTWSSAKPPAEVMTTMNVTSSTASLHPVLYCFQYSSGAIIFPVYAFTNAVILHPLHLLGLYVGVKRCRNRRLGHSDLFSCHTAMMETFGVWAIILFSCGVCADSEDLITISIFMFCMFFPGVTLLDCLTCVERYLAVAHPMIYRRRQKSGAARIRDVSIGCVWLLSFGCVGVAALYRPYFPTIPFLCLLGSVIILVSYCSFSILRILIRPGPGEAGKSRDGLNRTKQRAFRVTMIILWTLLLRFVGLFLCFGLLHLVSISENICVLMNCGIWLALPSSLVPSLLFLQRAGRLPCCRQSAEAE